VKDQLAQVIGVLLEEGLVEPVMGFQIALDLGCDAACIRKKLPVMMMKRTGMVSRRRRAMNLIIS
jgi:hypothetical protein